MSASFLFLGDLNGHHQEWLGSATTSCDGVAAFDFATVSGCDQMVVCLTHARGGTLDLIGIRFVLQCRIYPGVTFSLLTILLRV